MRAVFYYFGVAIALLAGAMLLPSLVAAASDDMRLLSAFLLSGTITAFAAGGLIFALGGHAFHLGRMDALILAASVWALAPVFAAMPLYISGAIDTFWLAYIEASSGFTTTGATVLKSLEGVPAAVLLWRATLQWFGGAMTLVSILLLLAPARLGGTPDSPLSTVEGAGGAAAGRIKGIAGRLIPTYAAATASCFILLVLTGIPAFDALCIAFSTLSTGGFMPVGGGLGSYDLPVAELVVAVFMWVGATSIIWYRLMLQQKWSLARQHREAWWIGIVIMLAGAAFGWGFYAGIDGPSGLDVLTSLQKGIVTASSVVTTTGFDFRPGGLAALSLPLLLTLCFFGGGGFSTAGGVKHYRLGAMLTQALRELQRLVHPHSIRGAKFGGQSYDMQLMKGIWSAFMGIGAAVATSTAIISATGMEFEASLTAAISALANIGPLYTSLQPGAEHWPAFAQFSTPVQCVFVVGMIAGRLEVLALLALFNPLNWHR